jgi:hypothetical protein
MVADYRARQSSTELLPANGGYVTKHSFGLHTATPGDGWARADPAGYQAQIEAMTPSVFTEALSDFGREPTGQADQVRIGSSANAGAARARPAVAWPAAATGSGRSCYRARRSCASIPTGPRGCSARVREPVPGA